MSENLRITAILAGDGVGFSRLGAAYKDRTLARLRALRGDPTIAVFSARAEAWRLAGVPEQ
jgi:hypothetical protein